MIGDPDDVAVIVVTVVEILLVVGCCFVGNTEVAGVVCPGCCEIVPVGERRFLPPRVVLDVIDVVR